MQYKKNGEIKPYTSLKELYPNISFPKESPPDDWQIYMPPPPTLEQVKATKKAQINQVRDEKTLAGFTYNGNTFDSDNVSIGRINSVFTFATYDPQHSQDFITADNQTVTLSAADCIGLGYAAGVHVQTQVFTARALKDSVEAAATIEEVEAITWPE